MKTKEINYESAMKELEQIVSKMENGDIDIDMLSKELVKARELIKHCKDKLTKTEAEIKAIAEK